MLGTSRQDNEPGKSCHGTIQCILTVQAKFLNDLCFEYRVVRRTFLSLFFIKDMDVYCRKV